MFLSKVKLSEKNKQLFIELATLLVTAEPRIGDNKEVLSKLNLVYDDYDILKKGSDNWFVATLEEVEALKICMLELGDISKPGSLLFGTVSTKSQITVKVLLEAFFKRDYVEPLKSIITEASSNSDYKKQVLMSFIELGVELSEIDQEKNEQCLAQIPEVRKQLINSVLDQIFEKFQVDELSLTARKIFLFELVSLAYSDGSLHELERLVIDTVAEKLNIDEATLDELKELSEEVIISVRNAAEVVFE